MTTIDQPERIQQPNARAIDRNKLRAFLFRAADEVGAHLKHTALVVMGRRFGLPPRDGGRQPLTWE